MRFPLKPPIRAVLAKHPSTQCQVREMPAPHQPSLPANSKKSTARGAARGHAVTTIKMLDGRLNHRHVVLLFPR